MALIKCIECGKEISDKAQACPNCGCPVLENVTETTISKPQQVETKIRMKAKKNIVIGIVFIIAIIVLFGFLILKNNSPKNKSLSLLKNELGEFGDDIELEGIFYNEGSQICVIGYYIADTEDIAVVDLENETVGLRSVYYELSENADNAITDTDKQKAAQSLLDYPYDFFVVNNLLNGNYDGWEVISD